MAKRVLLMYITEVSGHHRATLAIEKAIKVLSPETEVLNINAFHYTNPISEKVINKLYMGVIKRTPKIWDFLYDNQRIIKSVARLKNTINKFNSSKLKNIFDRFRPEVVACSQAFPCGMVAAYKSHYHANLPLVAVLTDYVPHSFWIYDNVDYYIAPSDEITLRLMAKGVALHKIKAFGIPFDFQFNDTIDKDTVRASLGFENLPTLLIMGGGHGLGPIKGIMESLEKIPLDLQEIVVTGANKELYSALSKNLNKFKKRIRVFSYVNNVNELMGVSDIIITKPGGITTAEALAKKLPMIIVSPLPGQEINNTIYLTEKGAAIKIENTKDIYFVIEDLLTNPDKLKIMRESAARINKPNSSIDIAKLILGS